MTTGQWQQSAPLIGLVGGRWTLPVLDKIAHEGLRYQDLRDALDGISDKVLTQTLRRAERDGLISRRLDLQSAGTAHLYEITDLGRSLDEPLSALERWIETSWHLVEAARRQWDRK